MNRNETGAGPYQRMLRTRLRAGSVTGVILAVTFALAFVLVACAELLVPGLRATPDAPVPVTIRIPYGFVFTAAEQEVRLEHRNLVIARGERPATPLEAAQVEAFERARRPPAERPGIFLGLYFLYFVIALVTTIQLRWLGARGALLRTQLSVLLLFLLFMIGAKAVLLLTSLSALMLPVAAIPLWTSMYLDRRASIIVSVALALVGASLLNFDLVIMGALLVQSTAAVLLFRERRHGRAVVASGFQAGFVSAALYVALMLYFNGRFDLMGDLGRGFGSGVLSAVAGGLLAGLVAFALSAPASNILGGVSRSRLLELAELDQPLLQKLAAEAPGSFAHARAMANLAEAAAQAISADALLIRVGAYYHDLGKTVQPKYFIENLEPDEVSPHEALEPDVSADAIMVHVVEGAKILRRGGIPEPVVEFAYTHHGSSLIEYFWAKCQEQGNPKGLTEASFRYPGMKPQTKETGILMLVDAIEATSRTIQPSREAIEQAIYRTVYSKIRQAQLDESGLTLADTHKICETLVETLVNAFHARIAYPWQKQPTTTPATAEHEPESPLPAGPAAEAAATKQ